MRSKTNNLIKDLIKVNRKKSREEEIAKFGKLISLRSSRIVKSKKLYKRKKRVEYE